MWQISALLACLLLAACSQDKPSSCKALSGSAANSLTIQNILNKAVTEGLDGIILSLGQGNTVPTSYVSGVQNHSTQLPMSADGLFKIASISKVFIAVSATKLAHRQLINLDETLNAWLPEIAVRIENGNSITIRQMLMHRSGIPDFGHQSKFNWADPHTDIEETLEYALDLPADFPPDSRYEYSNTNYLLIAKFLDKALGENHRNIIQNEILTPLGMKDTYYTVTEIDRSLMVKGYWGGVDQTNLDYTMPGGSMVSTSADIAVFFRALKTGELLNDDERETYSSIYRYHHAGILPGFQSIALYLEDTNTVVVQFVNTTGGASDGIASQTLNKVLCLLEK